MDWVSCNRMLPLVGRAVCVKTESGKEYSAYYIGSICDGKIHIFYDNYPYDMKLLFSVKYWKSLPMLLSSEWDTKSESVEILEVGKNLADGILAGLVGVDFIDPCDD